MAKPDAARDLVLLQNVAIGLNAIASEQNDLADKAKNPHTSARHRESASGWGKAAQFCTRLSQDLAAGRYVAAEAARPPEAGHVWDAPKHPGDTVRGVLLRRGDEIGDVRIMSYSQAQEGMQVRVAAFLPGHTVELPGDTPKTEATLDCWHTTRAGANRAYDAYLAQALADGWVEYRP